VKSQMRHQLGLNCLGFYEEAIGTLTGLTIDQGFLIARISRVILALPPEMESKLRTLIGTRIGILHTDIAGKEYLVRIIAEEKSSAFDQIEMIGLTKPKAQQVKASA
jgi:hypothetical protein